MSQLKKILVAYDGSSHSKKALSWGIELGILSEAEIFAVKVFEESELSLAVAAGVASLLTLRDEIVREEHEVMKAVQQRLMDEVAAAGWEKGVSVTGKVLQGNVAKEIIWYAAQNKVDLIIAGAKGQGVLEDLLMGSVTQKLVSLAHVPVMVVKD